jgi:chemotaxis signal transduction protein
MVDAVREVLHLRRDATAPTPRLGPGVRTDFIAGVGTAQSGGVDRIAFLLDVERVLRANELLTGRVKT